MFTGIITHTGILKKISKNKSNCAVEIKSKIKFEKKEIGSSISCNGACLTLEKYNKNISYFYVSNETLKRTVFKSAKVGDVINLEKSIKLGNRMSGHFVQGHVDTTGKINSITIRSKYCLKPYYIMPLPYFRIPAASGYPSSNQVLLGLIINTINIC